MSVMKRILRGLPRLRNAMLLGLAGLAARVPDDTPEVRMLTFLPLGQPCTLAQPWLHELPPEQKLCMSSAHVCAVHAVICLCDKHVITCLDGRCPSTHHDSAHDCEV